MTEKENPLNQFFDTSAEESEKYQVLKGFYDEIGIELKTDLRNSEIDAIIKTEFFEDILKDEFGLMIDLKGFTKQYKTHLVSRDRKGREEAMKVLSSDNDKEKTIIQKLLGEK